MTAERLERTAAAVIRVWIEPGETDVLRVRVIETVDLSRSPDTRVHPAVTSIDEACEIVRRWLVAFSAQTAVDADGAIEPADQPPD
jgi:hypothetical protein